MIMAESPQNPEIELHWFWRITTKPYFYFILYLVFALLLEIGNYIFGPGFYFVGLLFLPMGLWVILESFLDYFQIHVDLPYEIILDILLVITIVLDLLGIGKTLFKES